MSSNWMYAGNDTVKCQTYKSDTAYIVINTYDAVIFFDDYFCATCFAQDVITQKLLMIYARPTISVLERLKIKKHLQKYFPDADIFFLLKELPDNIHINSLMYNQ